MAQPATGGLSLAETRADVLALAERPTATPDELEDNLRQVYGQLFALDFTKCVV